MRGVIDCQLVPIYIFQIVLRCGSQTEFVTDEILKYSAAVSTDRAMTLIRNNQGEVSWLEYGLIFVVVCQRLHRRNNNIGSPPIFSMLFEDGGIIIWL